MATGIIKPTPRKHSVKLFQFLTDIVVYSLPHHSACLKNQRQLTSFVISNKDKLFEDYSLKSFSFSDHSLGMEERQTSKNYPAFSAPDPT